MPHSIKVLTWGGLRGGISVALALSLHETFGRENEFAFASYLENDVYGGDFLYINSGPNDRTTAEKTLCKDLSVAAESTCLERVRLDRTNLGQDHE